MTAAPEAPAAPGAFTGVPAIDAAIAGQDLNTNPRPRDWTILTPDDWWRIPLADRDRRLGSIKALIDQQFAGTSAPDSLRVGVEEELRRMASECAGNFGTDIWLATRAVQDKPIASSLLAQIVPGAGDLTELADTLRQDPDWPLIDTDVSPAGRVIRRVTERVTDEVQGSSLFPRTSKGQPLPVVVAEYWYSVPGWESLLQLTFSTPLLPLKDAFVELFDAVARSVDWAW